MGSAQTRPLRLVGRCEVFQEIDSGGMATVHLGRQTAVGGFAKIVAVKRMHHQFAKDPQFVAMFLDEARLVARIKHPNVLPTLDLIEEDGELFIVMDYLPGVTLGQLHLAVDKKSERIPMPIALRIVCGMLHGLHAAHEAKRPTGEPLGIVHRDVSPENILVGTDGLARLLDFGMARALDRLHITQAGQVKGKLSVMAPEQVQGKPVTRQTDVFASGVVLWQALTGKRLIQGEHIAEIAHNVVHQVFEPPSHLVPDLPRKLDAIIMRALDRTPALRWPTAEKMAVALEAVGDLASQRDVGQWVQRVAWEKLAERAKVVAAIEATPVGRDPGGPAILREASSPTIGEDSVGPVANSAPHSLDRLGTALAGIGQAARRWALGEGPAAKRRPDGRLDVPATVRHIVVDRPRAAVAALLLVGLSTFALVAMSGSGDEEEEARAPAAHAGLVPPAPVATGAPPAAEPAPAEPSPAGGRVRVPEGEFLLGCNTWADPSCAADEKPGRKVALGAFDIDRTEVTVAQYRACVSAGSCSADKLDSDGEDGGRLTLIDKCNFGHEGRGDHPVNCVSYEQAAAYCKWAGGKLPSEAQWEKAAAGSDSWTFPSGDSNMTCEKAVMSEKGDGCGRGTTWPVGQKVTGKSPYGALDMAGNVAEWVADWYDPKAYGSAAERDPSGPPQGSLRVVRGGSWRDPLARQLRTSSRDKRVPGTRSIQIGFRCAYPAGG